MNVKPCKHCRRPISWVLRATNRKPVPVDSAPLKGRRPRGDFLIVDRGYGYTQDAMTDRLRNALAFDKERKTVDDFPWHTIHVCPAKKDPR